MSFKTRAQFRENVLLVFQALWYLNTFHAEVEILKVNEKGREGESDFSSFTLGPVHTER